jgi:hypothetical protein
MLSHKMELEQKGLENRVSNALNTSPTQSHPVKVVALFQSKLICIQKTSHVITNQRHPVNPACRAGAQSAQAGRTHSNLFKPSRGVFPFAPHSLF